MDLRRKYVVDMLLRLTYEYRELKEQMKSFDLQLKTLLELNQKRDKEKRSF